MSKDNIVQLPKDVAELFTTDLVGGPKFDCGPFGVIDFSKITVAQAESLVKKGFQRLQRKDKKYSSTAATAIASDEKSTKK